MGCSQYITYFITFFIIYSVQYTWILSDLFHWFGLFKDVITGSDHFLYAPSQWETTLQCNVVSHWLGALMKWSLHRHWLNHILNMHIPFPKVSLIWKAYKVNIGSWCVELYGYGNREISACNSITSNISHEIYWGFEVFCFVLATSA